MESDESIHAHCDFQARWVFLSKFFIFVWFLFFIHTFKYLVLCIESSRSKRDSFSVLTSHLPYRYNEQIAELVVQLMKNSVL